MCMASAPQAPQIVYQGPSQAEIAANQSSLDAYKTQMTQQQGMFATQLQAQIDAANRETTDLKGRYDQEAAAAAAASASQQAGAYAASATQSEAPTTAQTTAAVMKKDKPKSNLRISTAGTPASAGTGLNIGV